MISSLLKNSSIDQIDAQLLLAHVLKKSREFLLAHSELPISKVQKIKYKWLLKKRTSGIPLAYLTGHKEFFGLDFLVNKHVLIPRPETEILVEGVVDEIESRIMNQKSRIELIDVGTGSGCIPISIYKTIQRQSSIFNLQSFHFFATDISSQALRLAKKNAQKHSVDITFLQGNLLQPLSNLLDSSLIITANLPYLTPEQFNEEPSIQPEPRSALVAENHGLALYKKFFHQIQSSFFNLHSSLSLFIEIDPPQSQVLSEYIKNIFPEANIQIIKDLSGNDRVIKIKNLR